MPASPFSVERACWVGALSVEKAALNNPCAACPISLALRHLNNSSSPESKNSPHLAESLASHSVNCLPSSTPCWNTIMSIKTSLSPERMNLSNSYCLHVLFMLCLVLISLCPAWWGQQWADANDGAVRTTCAPEAAFCLSPLSASHVVQSPCVSVSSSVQWRQ